MILLGMGLNDKYAESANDFISYSVSIPLTRQYLYRNKTSLNYVI